MPVMSKSIPDSIKVISAVMSNKASLALKISNRKSWLRFYTNLSTILK